MRGIVFDIDPTKEVGDEIWIKLDSEFCDPENFYNLDSIARDNLTNPNINLNINDKISIETINNKVKLTVIN